LETQTAFQTLNCEEFVAFITAYAEKNEVEATRAFYQYDDDNSGTVNAEELSALLSSLGVTPMKAVLQEILDEVDDDNTGTLDLGEFQAVMGIIYRREGFCKREFDRLMAAFRFMTWTARPRWTSRN